MLDDHFNLVSFGSLDLLLAELAEASDKVTEPRQRETEPNFEHVENEMLDLCSGLSLPSILFLRCVVRSVSDNVPLASIASGFHFFQSRIDDESLRKTVVKDWVLSATPTSLSTCIPVVKSEHVMRVLTQPRDDDYYCLFRFELAVAVAQTCQRSISTADTCYALVSNLPESVKINRLVKSSNWEDLRQIGFPLWVESHEELKRQCAALLRKSTADLNAAAPEDKQALRILTQQTLFWAVIGGCSPRTVAAWKWRDNPKIFKLLSADWNNRETRDGALRAAVAHKGKAEFMFAAAILIWLGDLPGACRDCLLRGLGDWQLCLLVADLIPGEQQRKVYLELWDDFVVNAKDPWLGVALARRMTLLGWEPPVSTARMLQSWMDSEVFKGETQAVSVRAGGVSLSSVCPGLQELELVMSKLGNR